MLRNLQNNFKHLNETLSTFCPSNLAQIITIQLIFTPCPNLVAYNLNNKIISLRYMKFGVKRNTKNDLPTKNGIIK